MSYDHYSTDLVRRARSYCLPPFLDDFAKRERFEEIQLTDARGSRDPREVYDVETREVVLETIRDLAVDFLNYDRRDDAELGRARLYDALDRGVVTVSQLVEHFAESLRENYESTED